MTAPFITFHDQGIDCGGFETEYVLAAVLPLMREVLAIHERGDVAPLRGLSSLRVIEDRSLGLVSPVGVPSERNDSRLRELLATQSRGLEVIGESKRETDIDTFAQNVTNLDVGSADIEITRPVYLPGYTTSPKR